MATLSSEPLRFAIIPTRDRPGDYADCVEALRRQVDVIVTVANSPEAEGYSYRSRGPRSGFDASEAGGDWAIGITVPYMTGHRKASFNISRAWNIGLEICEAVATGDAGRVAEWSSDWTAEDAANHLPEGGANSAAWNVAIVNDDVVVPAGWYDTLAGELAANRPGASGGRGYSPDDTHMAGFAFMLKGEDRMRLDEQFVYYYGDTDLQRQCEEAGGFALLPDLLVEHRHPGENVKGRELLVANDKRRYDAKWGRQRRR